MSSIHKGSTSKSPQPEVVTPRKQNVSCDACKFRRVKCDRQSKLEKSRNVEKEDDISCSVCIAHGLKCTFIQNKDKSRVRRGKRIAVLQQQLGDDAGSNPSSSSSIFTSTSGIPGEALADEGSHRVITTKGLFDIEGLTMPLLNACFQAYTTYYAPCLSHLQTEILKLRYRQFFQQLDQNNGVLQPYWVATANDSVLPDRHLSELFVLATGCIGASLLEPSQIDLGSQSKFRLQDQIALKFKEKLDDNLARRLEYEGTDIIESCYIMSDPFLSVIGNTLFFGSSPANPLTIRPTSPEGYIRLLFSLDIHRRPKLRSKCPPGDARIYVTRNGNFITEMEVFRRMRLFWTCFMGDSFRSMGHKSNVLISNEDYDWDLPRYIPRGDGTHDSILFCEREDYQSDGSESNGKSIACLQQNHFGEIDVIQFQSMLRLAFVIRQVISKLISPRSQGKSVLASDAERTVGAMKTWYQLLPAAITWEAMSEIYIQQNTARAKGDALKSFFLEAVYHAQVYNVWSSIDEYGLRSELDLADTAALFATSLSLSDDDDNSKQVASEPSLTVTSINNIGPSPDSAIEYSNSQIAPQSSIQNAQRKIDALMMQTFFRWAKIGSEGAKLGLIRASRMVFANVSRSCAAWGIDLVRKRIKSSKAGDQALSLPISLPPGMNDIDFILKTVDDLIFSLESVDSCEVAGGMAAQLKGQLKQVRLEVKAWQTTSQSVSTAALYSTGSSLLGATSSVFPYGEQVSPESNTSDSQQSTRSLPAEDMDWLQQYLNSSATNQHIAQEDSNDVPLDFNLFNGSSTIHMDLSQTEAMTFENLFPAQPQVTKEVDQSLSQYLAYSNAKDWSDAQWQGMLQEYA